MARCCAATVARAFSVGGVMFERFTEDARTVVVDAQQECLLLGHGRIGSEHLLLALLGDGGELGRMLQAAGVTLAVARAQVRAIGEVGEKEPSGHLRFTPRAKRVLEQSLRVAQRLGQDHIGRSTILRGLLEVRDAVAVQVLVSLGVDVGALAATADDLVVAEGLRLAVGEASLGHRGSAQSGAGPQLPTEELVAQISRLSAQRDRLASGLRVYGRHLQGCDPDRGCSCGLGALLDLTREQ
jgi:ATP-dependent Clp protease ATP-binding subunit ClpA